MLVSCHCIELSPSNLFAETWSLFYWWGSNFVYLKHLHRNWELEQTNVFCNPSFCTSSSTPGNVFAVLPLHWTSLFCKLDQCTLFHRYLSRFSNHPNSWKWTSYHVSECVYVCALVCGIECVCKFRKDMFALLAVLIQGNECLVSPPLSPTPPPLV